MNARSASLSALLALALTSAGLAPAQDVRPATFYVAPDGDDRHAGTIDAPWGTLAQAFERLQPGDELILRGGSYQQDTLYAALQGEPDAPITIRNHLEERPIIDGRHLEFLGDQGDQWELVDPMIHLYRSKQVYEQDSLSGNLEQDGQLYKLNAYSRFEELASTNHSWSEETPVYVGPGIHHGQDGHIYIRLERPDPEAIFMTPEQVAALPPADPDPDNNRLHISTQSTGMKLLKKARHVVIEGVNFEMQHICLRIQNASFVTLRDLSIRCGQWALTIADSHDITIEAVAFELNVPPWISWSDVKSEPRPAGTLKATGVSIDDGVYNVEIVHCRFVDVFDGVTATSKDLRAMRIHHNVFSTKDDALQLGTATSDIVFDHNLVIGPGPSHHGTGDAEHPGRKYFHHNIIDASRPILWGRADPEQQLKEKRRGWRHPRPLGTHSGSIPSRADPWKIYHNTFLLGRDASSGGVGMRKWGDGPVGASHEAYNNVIVQTEDEWAAMGLSIDANDEIYDGNLYFRPAAAARTPLFRRIKMRGQEEDFYSFDTFRRSTVVAASTDFYPPGWESLGVEADPGLKDPMNGDYRPSRDGPAASGGIDLRGKGWPGVETARSFRGAVDPEASNGLGDIGPESTDLEEPIWKIIK